MMNLDWLLTRLETLGKRLTWYPYRGRVRLSYRLSRLRSHLIGPHGVAVLADTVNGKLLVPSGDFVMGRQLAFRGAYCLDELAQLYTKIGAESEVLVVGAHVGALLIPLAGRAKVTVGVEANPATFQLLAFNVKINGLEKKVEILNFAAGDRVEEVEFMANVHNSGQSKLKTDGASSTLKFTYDSPETVRIPMRRLDDVLTGRQFDLIVLDLEGSEVAALRGMPRILVTTRCLMIEIHPDYYSTPKQATLVLTPFLEPKFQAASIVHGPNVYSLQMAELEKLISKAWGLGVYDLFFDRFPNPSGAISVATK